ncbi:hypothetical protein A7U60_g6769 [Sanghuangporus baumii]|uniref:Uncharacterized protein n=1 Tax=Sanghuangporus baumii TaxID=108892 RepID=A0A9Q5HUK3_SANBA|nr:hypothetical protein A7U60_g6769 [Sanghuangporus baumii]
MSSRSVFADARGHVRDRSFTVEQFEELVHSALDAQSLPDNALSFSFGGNTYPSSLHSPHSSRAKDASRRKTGPFSRLRGAFTRKQGLSDASFIVPPETRRLASSSVPTLALLQSKKAPTSDSYISLDIPTSHCNAPSSRTWTAGPKSFLGTSLSSSDFTNGSQSYSCSPSLDISPRERSSSSSRSLLGLKPLTIPKLTNGGLFSSGSLPTPPDFDAIRGASPAATDDFVSIEPESMYSFFDDSGFEDLCTPNVTRKKSKASFRSLFSSAASEGNASSHHSGSKRDKALPPTPACDRTVDGRRRKFRPEVEVLNSADDRRNSLFYSPPTIEQCDPGKTSTSERSDSKSNLDKEFKSNRMTDWIVRSTSSTPRKLKRLSRSSAPAYPSPTSPLPPTPNLPFTDLPVDALRKASHVQNTNDVGNSTEESIDSMEILRWRMPNLEQQASKTSTTSSARAHALGRPSRGSIRDRLGLGPRLHVHVPLPSQFVVDPTRRSKSQHGISSEATIRKTNSPLPIAPPSSSRLSSSSRIPLPRLASASFVSLRSITTVTARSKGSGGENEEDNRMDVLDIDRAFTPEDDPFAADPPTPLTPLTPVNPTYQTQTSKEEKYHSFMRLGNDSSASCVPETPISAPASLPSWHYRLGSNSNISSPVLMPSSLLPGATPVPRRSKRNASPSSVRSRLAPSLVEPLSIRRRSPSAPPSPPSGRQTLTQVISRVRRIQGNQIESGISNLTGKGHTSGIVGHTESRPHSPFPMLVTLTPGSVKAAPNASSDRRSTAASFVWSRMGEQDVVYSLEGQAVERVQAPLGQIKHPTSPSVVEIDAFGPVSEKYAHRIPDRDMLSPTAWLLDSDDYDDNNDMHEPETLAAKSNVLALSFNVIDEPNGQLGGNGTTGRTGAVLASNCISDARSVSPSRGVFDTESEIEPKADLARLRAPQNWPLPPHRTVVVDEESGEGFHLVEPVLEFIQTGSAMHSPRHSIRFPKRCSGSMSIESLTSHLSGGSSPISQRLNSSQTRLIAEQFGKPALRVDNDATSPSSMQVPQALPTQHLKQRSRSATSLASVSAWSARTSRTAFYSARSTVSRGSDKSAYSFAQSRQVGKLSREGSSRSAASSHSPPSSADHHAKSSSSHRMSSGSVLGPTASSTSLPRGSAI